MPWQTLLQYRDAQERQMSNFPALPITAARLLTPRECEVASYLATGRPNKVVAIELGISLRTAEAHRARIFRKLGVRNTVELACSLCRHGGCSR
ncbi:Helix-turn-helix transcriptional regulator [Bordetella muralis]|jgi:DNA-binding NarL/FixJ family response regulator